MGWEKPFFVTVEKLHLNPKNYRLRNQNIASDNEAILKEMWNQEQSAIMSLIKTISRDGFGPENLTVKVHENKDDEYIVREGNTRLSAILLLLNPNLCPNDKMKKEITRHSNGMDNQDILNNLECRTADEKTLVAYERGRHTSGKEYSINSWDTLAKQKADTAMGETGRYPITSAIAEKLGLEIPDKNISLLEAILKKGIGSGAIGIEKSGDNIVATHDNAKIILDKICHDVKTKKVNSRTLNKAEDFDKYVEKFESEKGNKKSSPLAIGLNVKVLGGRPQGSLNKKKYLLDKITDKMPSYSSKAQQIFKELSEKLIVADVPYATAFTLRCFIELSVSHYWEENNITSNSNNMLNKIESIFEHMKTNGKMKRGDDKKLMPAIGTHFPSYNTLNYLIHDPAYEVDVKSLKAFWNNIRPFVKSCWT